DREGRVVEADAVLQQRLDLGPRRARVVGPDAEPAGGREAGLGDLGPGLRRAGRALYPPAAEPERPQAPHAGPGGPRPPPRRRRRPRPRRSPAPLPTCASSASPLSLRRSAAAAQIAAVVTRLPLCARRPAPPPGPARSRSLPAAPRRRRAGWPRPPAAAAS